MVLGLAKVIVDVEVIMVVVVVVDLLQPMLRLGIANSSWVANSLFFRSFFPSLSKLLKDKAFQVVLITRLSPCGRVCNGVGLNKGYNGHGGHDGCESCSGPSTTQVASFD